MHFSQTRNRKPFLSHCRQITMIEARVLFSLKRPNLSVHSEFLVTWNNKPAQCTQHQIALLKVHRCIFEFCDSVLELNILKCNFVGIKIHGPQWYKPHWTKSLFQKFVRLFCFCICLRNLVVLQCNPKQSQPVRGWLSWTGQLAERLKAQDAHWDQFE